MTMKSPFLVTPKWLAQHINDEDLMMVGVRMPPVGLTPKKAMRAAFANGHIPSAVYFDINDMADKNTDLPHILPTAEAFSKAVGKLGINEQQPSSFMTMATRSRHREVGGFSAISAHRMSMY